MSPSAADWMFPLAELPTGYTSAYHSVAFYFSKWDLASIKSEMIGFHSEKSPVCKRGVCWNTLLRERRGRRRQMWCGGEEMWLNPPPQSPPPRPAQLTDLQAFVDWTKFRYVLDLGCEKTLKTCKYLRPRPPWQPYWQAWFINQRRCCLQRLRVFTERAVTWAPPDPRGSPYLTTIRETSKWRRSGHERGRVRDTDQRKGTTLETVGWPETGGGQRW